MSTATHTPGKIRLSTLMQTEKWWDVNGVEHDIATMDSRHRSHLVPFLLRRAERLHLLAVSRLLLTIDDTMADGVFNSLTNALGLIEQQSPRDWLLNTPLVRQLIAMDDVKMGESS